MILEERAPDKASSKNERKTPRKPCVMGAKRMKQANPAGDREKIRRDKMR